MAGPVDKGRADAGGTEGCRVRLLQFAEGQLGLALDAPKEGCEEAWGERGALARDVDEVEGSVGSCLGREGLEGLCCGEGVRFGDGDVFPGIETDQRIA